MEGAWKPCETRAYRGGREAQLCSFGLSGGRPASPLVRVQRALDVSATSPRAREHAHLREHDVLPARSNARCALRALPVLRANR